MALLLWGGPIDEDGPIDVGWPYRCGVALLLWDGPIAMRWPYCCRMALWLWDGPIDVGWPY